MAKNKKQRNFHGLKRIPAKDVRSGQVVMMPLSQIHSVQELPADECREFAVMRVTLNLKETRHPFHHKAADGTIVTPDPTLEYLLSRLSEEQRKQFLEIYTPSPEQEAQAPRAVAVDRKHYGEDPYAGLL